VVALSLLLNKEDKNTLDYPIICFQLNGIEGGNCRWVWGSMFINFSSASAASFRTNFQVFLFKADETSFFLVKLHKPVCNNSLGPP